MKLWRDLCAAGMAIAIPSLCLAQTAASQSATSEQSITATPSSAAQTVRVPAETVIGVEVTAPLGSRTSHIGDAFALRLADPIVINGQIVVPAGVVGQGEVIDAKPGGFGGAPGRLIVSARYLELNGQHVRIHGMQLTAAGRDRSNLVQAVALIPYAGVASLFMTGGEIQIPAGAVGTAKLGADVDVTPPLASTATAQPIASTSTSGEKH